MRRTLFALALLAACGQVQPQDPLLQTDLQDPVAQARAEMSRPSTCADLSTCLDEMTNRVRTGGQVRYGTALKLAQFGDAAADALIPLLRDPNPVMQESAGLALTAFERLPARHLPALVRAWRQGRTEQDGELGNGWMPKPIAATGTDEALRLLWADYRRDPEESSNAQTLFGLAKFEAARLRPLLEARFEGCRRAGEPEPCLAAPDLLELLKPPNPEWSVELMAGLASIGSDRERAIVEGHLVKVHHPIGLAGYVRRLRERATSPEPKAFFERPFPPTIWLVAGTASYGEQARGALEPLLAVLRWSDDSEVRAQAVWALGRIENPQAGPILMSLAPRFADDWLLAYNAVESIGRLRPDGARSLLRSVAFNYWHRGVRAHARRAIAALDGSPFPTERRSSMVEGLDARHDADMSADQCRTPPLSPVYSLDSDPVGLISWPLTTTSFLNVKSVDLRTRKATLRRLPDPDNSIKPVFVLPVKDGHLVGTNGGEFGGGVHFVPTRGSVQRLSYEPVNFAWRMGGLLYVASGLAHLGMNTGTLFVIDTARVTITREVRLPAEPRAARVNPERTIVINTARGDVVVHEDGTLLNPAKCSR